LGIPNYEETLDESDGEVEETAAMDDAAEDVEEGSE
jgi:hypothetical protein